MNESQEPKKEALKKPFIKKVSKKFTIFSLKAGVALLGVLVILFIYFDSVVLSKFEVDDKWVLPAVVYSMPLELYPDQRLSLTQMVYELNLLKYREVANPKDPGEYAVNYKNSRIVVIKRPFAFPDAYEDRTALLIQNNGAVCVGATFDDAEVSAVVFEKACKTVIESSFLGGGRYINPIECWLMHLVYKLKYSKQAKK